ncbi:mitogen-activated protein kinase kinase kinase 17 [Cajanus cajan]|uniref:Mitogen-activated protein kinase kinase kinase 3 n=1 Tax=Cajanus cajan TaxID=3821 RepID=A0A151TIE9_CAJCA|nr:mitogen-activated protein kinase kinase kinase 17 [Cajanus cajan]KYP66835.1 Mitogen-activated protein kinase kinase kinase 3 [Cajanus cajan]
MNWIRGDSLGTGSFATVNKLVPTHTSAHFFPSPTAVKSSDLHTAASLKNEKEILDRIRHSPYIIKCYGHDSTIENGQEFYNVFLEHAAGGSLADQLKKHGGTLPESYVRRCTRSVVEALRHIHAEGFVHCDVKLQNILVFDDDEVKVADFGLAKEKGRKEGKWECRGTPLFMSPEAVNENEYESAADIWALGCAVVEMVTGKPAWEVRSGVNIWALLIRIGVGEELPKIPEELSEEGKDFLRKCFVKDPNTRWSAEMLLEHPFINDHCVSFKKVNGSLPSPSPRTHFDFPDWASTVTSSLPSSPDSGEWCQGEFSLSCSPASRLRRLGTDELVPMGWSGSDDWIDVR